MTTFKTILHRGAGENNVRCLDHSGRSLRFLHPVLVEREFIILPVSGTNALMAILTSSITDSTAPSAKSSLITVDVLNYTTPVMAPTLDRTSKVVIITGVTLETPLSISPEAILAFDMLGAIEDCYGLANCSVNPLWQIIVPKVIAAQVGDGGFLYYVSMTLDVILTKVLCATGAAVWTSEAFPLPSNLARGTPVHLFLSMNHDFMCASYGSVICFRTSTTSTNSQAGGNAPSTADNFTIVGTGKLEGQLFGPVVTTMQGDLIFYPIGQGIVFIHFDDRTTQQIVDSEMFNFGGKVCLSLIARGDMLIAQCTDRYQSMRLFVGSVKSRKLELILQGAFVVDRSRTRGAHGLSTNGGAG